MAVPKREGHYDLWESVIRFNSGGENTIFAIELNTVRVGYEVFRRV